MPRYWLIYSTGNGAFSYFMFCLLIVELLYLGDYFLLSFSTELLSLLNVYRNSIN